MERYRKEALERMGWMIVEQENGCTSWRGSIDKDGYARFWWNGRTRNASRALWEIIYGAIPDGIIVRHKCDNPECLNISHLELGTPKQNTQDAIERGHWGKSRKVNKDVSKSINALRSKGMRIFDIASTLKISSSSIYTYLEKANKRQGSYARGEHHWNSRKRKD